MIQWMHQTYGMTTTDVRTSTHLAFQWASPNDCLAVMQWLHDTFLKPGQPVLQGSPHAVLIQD